MDDDARFMARTPAGEPYELCNLYAAYAEGEGGSPKPQMVRKMRGWGFSWLALLLTPLYLLYRKQYLAAGCWIAVRFEQGATNVREALAYVRRCGGTSFAAVGVGFAVVFALAVVEVLAGI